MLGHWSQTWKVINHRKEKVILKHNSVITNLLSMISVTTVLDLFLCLVFIILYFFLIIYSMLLPQILNPLRVKLLSTMFYFRFSSLLHIVGMYFEYVGIQSCVYH